LLLVDDHTILREGLRALLELQPDLRVVGEASTFEEAIELATRLQPAIVLHRYRPAGPLGACCWCASCARSARRRASCSLRRHASEEYIRAGLDARADGYVLKDSGHAELIAAIRTVAVGQHFLCKAVASRVLATYVHGDDPARSQDPLAYGDVARTPGSDAHRVGTLQQDRGTRAEPQRQDG